MSSLDFLEHCFVGVVGSDVFGGVWKKKYNGEEYEEQEKGIEED